MPLPILWNRVSELFEQAKHVNARGANDLAGLGEIARLSLRLLEEDAQHRVIGVLGDKEYHTFHSRTHNTDRLSRPILDALFVYDSEEFSELWAEVRNSIDGEAFTICHPRLMEAVYTCAMSYAGASDLYSGDRQAAKKPPGTFYEMLTSALVGSVTGLPRGKSVAIEGDKITTDLFVHLEGGDQGIIIANKITSRERLSQAYVHQLLLERIAGEGLYRGLFVGVSEMQRAGDDGVNEVCVPNQIALYQSRVAKLQGLYYLDPPNGYLNAEWNQPENEHYLPVRTLADLFCSDLADHVKWLQEQDPIDVPALAPVDDA